MHSQTTGSEVSFRRGTARSLDHAQMVHTQWLQAAVLGLEVWVKRVKTEDNIADLPSRRVRHNYCVLSSSVYVFPCCQDFALLNAMGALEVAPRLHDDYECTATWEVLQERWLL